MRRIELKKTYFYTLCCKVTIKPYNNIIIQTSLQMHSLVKNLIYSVLLFSPDWVKSPFIQITRIYSIRPKNYKVQTRFVLPMIAPWTVILLEREIVCGFTVSTLLMYTEHSVCCFGIAQKCLMSWYSVSGTGGVYGGSLTFSVTINTRRLLFSMQMVILVASARNHKQVKYIIINWDRFKGRVKHIILIWILYNFISPYILIYYCYCIYTISP